MAGVVREASTSLESYRKPDGPFIPGLFRGTVPFSQWQLGRPSFADTSKPASLSAERVVVSKSAVPIANVVHEAVLGENAVPTTDFFDAIHLLPTAKIQFGSIITQIEETFEIYSAYRTRTVLLATLTNNALPGISTPDTVLPSTMHPQASLFASTSTPNDQGTGLGTIVLQRVVAEAIGLSIFDTTLDFEVTASSSPDPNDVVLFISGQRIVLIPFRYETPFSEQLGCLTKIITSMSGREQRIRQRGNPRQAFLLTFDLDGEERQSMEAILFNQTNQIAALPLWHESVPLTAASSAGALSFATEGVLDVDFRIGGLAAIITDRLTFDVVTINGLTDTLISFDSPTLNSYPLKAEVAPIRLVIFPDPTTLNRRIVESSKYQLKVEVIDNDTGALSGDTSLGGWDTYNGRVLFNDCNVMSGTERNETSRRRIYRSDNKTGVISISSPWDHAKKESTKRFIAHNRVEIMALRRLWIGVFGRQKSFYIPSFIGEVTVSANIVPADLVLTILSISYTTQYQSRSPANIIHMIFTDGTELVRTVLSSIGGAATEQLGLNAVLGVTKTPDEIDRVEFYELVRFDSDTMNLKYERTAFAEAELPIVRVFDDN